MGHGHFVCDALRQWNLLTTAHLAKLIRDCCLSGSRTRHVSPLHLLGLVIFPLVQATPNALNPEFGRWPANGFNLRKIAG
jgi:hypothetical protein